MKKSVLILFGLLVAGIAAYALPKDDIVNKIEAFKIVNVQPQSPVIIQNQEIAVPGGIVVSCDCDCSIGKVILADAEITGTVMRPSFKVKYWRNKNYSSSRKIPEKSIRLKAPSRIQRT